MSAFDSAMLMIDDLSKQVVELEQKVWDLQLAIWHKWLSPDEGVCTGKKCPFCKTEQEAFFEVEGHIREG
jgi:hypothetical protein